MRKVLIQQLDQQLDKIRAIKSYASPPQNGWVRSLRKALGMTTQQLATRLNVQRSRVIQIEHNELEGRITLSGLKKAAAALDCELIYALVPKDSIEHILEQLAARVSKEILDQVDHSMRLEKQGLTQKQKNIEKQEIIRELLSGSLKNLWENELRLKKVKKKDLNNEV